MTFWRSPKLIMDEKPRSAPFTAVMWRALTSTGCASWLRDQAFCTTWSASSRALWWKWGAGTERLSGSARLWHHWIAANLVPLHRPKDSALSGCVTPTNDGTGPHRHHESSHHAHLYQADSRRITREHAVDVSRSTRSWPSRGVGPWTHSWSRRIHGG